MVAPTYFANAAAARKAALTDREVIQAAVATAAEVEAVIEAFPGGDAAAKLELAMKFVFYCADNGSSRKSEWKGTVGGTTYAALAKAVGTVTTPRRFCAFFAKVVWLEYTSGSQEPQNVQKKGFTDSNKCAAFDFFHGVLCDAALDPEATPRLPTDDERRAAELCMRGAIMRSREETVWSTNAQITANQQARGPNHRGLLE